MTTDRNVILYISMSLDGYIATKDNSLEFLSMVEQEGEDYGYNDFVKSVDAVIIGRKTYEKVIAMGYEYPHTDKDVYILTLHDKLTMKVYRSNDPTNIKIAQLLTAYWQKISINKITAKNKFCKRTHANNQH